MSLFYLLSVPLFGPFPFHFTTGFSVRQFGYRGNSNTAEFETKVELAHDQNVVYGKIAPQSKFSKMDPKQQPRNGGGEQVITDGGYNSGAVCTKDPKYPVPAKQSIMKRVNEHKAKHGIKTSITPHKSNAVAYRQSKSKGQSRS